MSSTSSITVAMRTAVAGLSVNQTALQTTSNNIANANTIGFTKKTVNLEPVLLDGQGAGVQVASITRRVNEFLLRDMRAQTSLLGDITVRSEFYEQTQEMFGSPDSNTSIGARMTSLENMIQALAIEPASPGEQFNVVSAAQTLTRQFNQMAQQVQDLRNHADDQIDTAIDNVNALLGHVAELNGQIVNNLSLNRPAGDLQDQRDLAVAELANYMDIGHFTRPTGETVIFSSSGRTLVDQTATELSYTPASSISALQSYPSAGIDGITMNGVDITTEFGSGRIKGLIDMRDTDMPAMNAELDRLASVLKEQINAIHNDGVAFPPLSTMTGTRTFSAPATDTVNMSGVVRIAVVDADGNAVGSAFDLSFADLATVVGGTPTVNQIRDAINGAYAASTPAIPGLAGATASVNADGQLVIDADTAGQGIAINEGTSAESVTGYGFSHYFGLNDLFVASTVGGTAVNIAVRSDIVASPQLLSRGELTSGTLTSGMTAIAIGDGSVAQRLAAAFSEDFSFAAAGNLATISGTLSGYGASILSGNANRAASNEESRAFRSTVLDDIRNKADSESGVNMDEEMADLVLFQNSYAASARVISTLSEMLDTLVRMV